MGISFLKEIKMDNKKCDWEDTGDAYFITQCKNEYAFSSLYDPVDLEDVLNENLFVFCPYCGRKINFIQH